MGDTGTMTFFHATRAIFLPALSVFLCLVLLSACGKEGMPSPKKKQDVFDIAGSRVSPIGDCLVAEGSITGAVANVESVLIEIAPILSYDDCPGCPFVAQEHGEFSASGIDLDRESGQFIFSFCPSTPAPMYRWRLVGKSVFSGLPDAATTPRVAIMPQK